MAEETKYRLDYNQRRYWKLPIGFPDDPKTKKEQKAFFEESGNGWWWYRNTSDRIRATSTPSKRNRKAKGGSLAKSGGRRGL